MVWGYPHELEYRFERAKGYREHLYTELVDDMGFVLEHRSAMWEGWLVRYTGACAEDYLRRVRAKHGVWLVSVYALLPPDHARKHRITVRVRWNSQKVGSVPVGEVSRRTTMGM